MNSCRLFLLSLLVVLVGAKRCERVPYPSGQWGPCDGACKGNVCTLAACSHRTVCYPDADEEKPKPPVVDRLEQLERKTWEEERKRCESKMAQLTKDWTVEVERLQKETKEQAEIIEKLKEKLKAVYEHAAKARSILAEIRRTSRIDDDDNSAPEIIWQSESFGIGTNNPHATSEPC